MFHHIWNVFFENNERTEKKPVYRLTLEEIVQNAMMNMEGGFNEQMLIEAVQEKIKGSYHEFENEDLPIEVRECIKTMIARGSLKTKRGMYYPK